MIFWAFIWLKTIILFICYSMATSVIASVGIIIALTVKLVSKSGAKKIAQTESITETKDGDNTAAEDFELHSQ